MTTPPQTVCFILSLLLASCSLAGPDRPQRVVRVKALADEPLRKRSPAWAAEVNGLIEAASDYFEREFGIRLATRKIARWSPADSGPFTAPLLSELKREFPLEDADGSYDLIIGFTGRQVNTYAGRARVDRIGNCQQGLGNYLVSYVSGPFRYEGPNAEPTLDVVALLHELGHIFGAEHVKDTGSIMNEHFDYRPEFDRKSRETILKNRNCPFGKG